MTLDELEIAAGEQNKADILKFMQDMRKAGLSLMFYQGRNFYKGPAVRVNMIQDGLSLTKVKCNYDNLGKGYVVHPYQGLN